MWNSSLVVPRHLIEEQARALGSYSAAGLALEYAKPGAIFYRSGRTYLGSEPDGRSEAVNWQ